MKLVFMQNNDEQIFDRFIRGSLENTAPDMTLLDSSFSIFLLERKGKKKRRRWFFWLFLFMTIFIIPFGYYIISNKNNLTNTNEDVNKKNISIDTKNTSTILNTETREQKNLSDTAFMEKKEFRNSVQHHLAEETETEDVDKFQKKKINAKLNTTVEQIGVFNKTMPADSGTLFSNVTAKNIIKAGDSVMKKKVKTVAKEDTFYIVW
jgi:hypothetical protein